MASDALKRDILAEVAKHDGQWYWYQRDRRLVGVHPPEGLAELMQAVNELSSDGMIDVKPNPILGEIPRYWLTDAGRLALGREV